MDIRCSECNVEFSLPPDMYARRKEDGKAFYCPNGHGQCYRVTEKDKLKSLNDALNKEINELKKNCGSKFLLKFIVRICPDCRSSNLFPYADGNFQCQNCKLENTNSKMKWKLKLDHKTLNEYFDNSKD